jgi:Raf kinase inhibitor-like YbhB/YbcL family protein
MTLELASPAFADGDRIPERYGHGEANENPPLSIAGVPADAASLALVVDDPDAVEPAGTVWDHWTVWNVPPRVEEIPAGWTPDADGATTGTNDFDERGYGGPAPPDREHTYRFKLYALDTELDLPPTAGRDDVAAAIEGHVLEQAVLEGTYAP